MDFAEDTKATPPDCWAGFGRMVSDIKACSSEDLLARTEQFDLAAYVESAGQRLEDTETLIDQLVRTVKQGSGTPEAILAARYLAASKNAPEQVLQFCTLVLHEIMYSSKVVQMEQVAVEVIQSMSCYGDKAAAYALDVVGCLLLKDCPAEVKHAALEFLVRTAAPRTCNVVFEKVLRQTGDPDITQWVEGHEWGEEGDHLT